MLNNLWRGTKLVASLVLILILVHIVNAALDGQLVRYGIIPRSEEHWFHIFTSPFIHGDLAHLINNLFGLGIFSVLCLFRTVAVYVVCSLFVITLTGVLVWFFGRDAFHIGASGWIFGLWSFSIAIAWFDRRLINIFVGFLVVFLYGGMIYGVLPSDPNISFEAHLFGAVSGVVFAFLYSLYLRMQTRRLSKTGGKSD